MPRWMRHFLARRSLAFHFWTALVTAVVLRGLCSYFVYGPQALDDYKHGVYPAYLFFAGLPLDLPDYRSHLLVWLLASFLEVGSWFGADSALAQVRVMYAGLGLVSLCGLFGTYLMVRTVRSRLFGALALYLVAAFPLMPFLSTRAFGESVATGLVLLAFGILENARRTRRTDLLRWTLGFTVLGAAVLFRFHVGLLFVSYALILLGLRQWSGFAGSVCGGVLTLAAQYAVDYFSDKPAFGTLFSYLAENEGGASKYGVSPWYNTWLFILVVSLAPFSFVFWRKVPALWRRHWPWLAPALVYVAAHSVVPHKEERFLYPVVGLELWAVAWLWASGAYFKWARRLYADVLLTAGVPLLILVCFVNSQEGEIEPPAYAQSRYGKVLYFDNESLFGASRFQFYFLRPPSVLESVEKQSFNARKIDEGLEGHPDFKAVVLLTSLPDARDQLHALEGIKTMESQCQRMRSAGSWIDRLLYALNPKHNERRRPTWYLVCERA